MAERGQQRILSPNGDFLFCYSGLCKHLTSTPGGLPVSQQEHMQKMLEVVTRKLRFDESYNHDKVWVYYVNRTKYRIKLRTVTGV